MIRKFAIKNYKSVLDLTIELGRINVFIGENGCGKTNILEAMAMASAALEGKLDVEGLYSKGVRVAKHSLTLSSFAGQKPAKNIQLRCDFGPEKKDLLAVKISLSAPSTKSANHVWIDKGFENIKSKGIDGSGNVDRLVEMMKSRALTVEEQNERIRNAITRLNEAFDSFKTGKLSKEDFGSITPKLDETVNSAKAKMDEIMSSSSALNSAVDRGMLRDFFLADYAIYNVHAVALRGIDNVSKKTPLGIHGESLDVLIASFDQAERDEILRRARMISWINDVIIDADDELKFHGYKLGRSASTLYFKDKFMRRNSNTFSAENANEGILHILFYLALFVSKNTPATFGVDNIETALNPQLCRNIIKELAVLAKERGKQALITTHNPAILDGLNLHDDEQRLFVVSRNDEGHTVTRRVKVKPENTGPQGEKLKLSELWMRGMLGGIPQSF